MNQELEKWLIVISNVTHQLFIKAATVDEFAGMMDCSLVNFSDETLFSGEM